MVKAVTAGAAGHAVVQRQPRFRSGEEIIYKKYYNIGFAADAGKGLIVPVIDDVDTKLVMVIARELAALAQRVATSRRGRRPPRRHVHDHERRPARRHGRSSPSIPSSTIPEVAILGVGRVQGGAGRPRRPDRVAPHAALTLTFDHRVADGADGARFVTEMVRQLSDPNLLLLET